MFFGESRPTRIRWVVNKNSFGLAVNETFKMNEIDLPVFLRKKIVVLEINF